MKTDANGEGTPSPFLIEVVEADLSLERCYQFVASPCCGAVSTFVGTTRDNFEGKKVMQLSYEGYVPMAKKELTRLCNEAITKFGVHKIAVQHILGDCPVGQASVIIAVSSSHRRESLDCVRFMIDELKKSVPIWKREMYEGDEKGIWKENSEWHANRKSTH